jgi:hypothetical protein
VLSETLPWEQRLENTQFIGYLPIALAFAGFIGASIRLVRRRGDWLDGLVLRLGFVAVVGFVLSLGPFLWMGPRFLGWPLPFRLLYEWVPPMRFMRATARFAFLVSWPAAFASGVYLARAGWFNRSGVYTRSAIFAALLAVLTLEYRPVKAPVLVDYDLEGMKALQKHPEFHVVAPVPIDNLEFLIDAAETFPDTPVGWAGGAFNFRYQLTLWHLRSFPSEQGVANYAALDVDSVIAYGGDALAAAHANPFLDSIDEWQDGGLFRLVYTNEAMISEARARLDLPSRPWTDLQTEFPPTAPPEARFTPAAWLIDDAGKEQWVDAGWQEIPVGGYVYTDLHDRLGASMEPRRLGDIADVYVKVSVNDVGIDFAEAALSWVTLENPDLADAPYSSTYIRPNGQTQVLRFNLNTAANYRPDDHVTRLFFSIPVATYPGQRVRIDEIRFAPPSP